VSQPNSFHAKKILLAEVDDSKRVDALHCGINVVVESCTYKNSLGTNKSKEGGAFV
jgi:hypothetical protein